MVQTKVSRTWTSCGNSKQNKIFLEIYLFFYLYVFVYVSMYYTYAGACEG